MQQGYTQVYTGDGKGKTTAALGLALRAAGAGLKVFMVQFIKNGDFSELKALRHLAGQIKVEQFGRGRFNRRQPDAEDMAAARLGFTRIQAVLAAGEHAVVILDEANVAVGCGLLSVADLLELMACKPAHVELVITGRGADPRVLAKADLVTEMKAVKHYYQNGVAARVGIEK
jgi:cob(I)alamin adenosyltransferase